MSQSSYRDGEEVGRNDTNDTYDVYASRTRTALYAVGGLLLGLGAAWLLVSGNTGGLVTTLVSILAVPLFLGGGVAMLYRVAKNDPVLRINREGIHHNKLIGESKFFPWDDVERIGRVEQETHGTTQTHLQLQVSELDADASTLSRVLRELNKATLGDDADAHYVPLDSYGIQFEEVAEATTRYSDVPVETADS